MLKIVRNWYSVGKCGGTVGDLPAAHLKNLQLGTVRHCFADYSADYCPDLTADARERD
jgi:hypothetical protein